MNARERKQEEQELQQAVKVTCAAVRGIAHRKARRYEQEFLLRVRDMIDIEIKNDKEINNYLARHISDEIETEITKGQRQ